MTTNLLWLHVRKFSKLSRRLYKKLKRIEMKRMEGDKCLPFLLPLNEGYDKLKNEKYRNFFHLPNASFPQDLAQDVAWAFNKLESEGYFYRHWVMVQGRHVMTPVSRTLIGDPGMTYRYLGLRIFALPWSFEDGKELNEVEQACSIIRRLNQFLKTTSCQVLKNREEQTNCKREQSQVEDGNREVATDFSLSKRGSVCVERTKNEIISGGMPITSDARLDPNSCRREAMSKEISNEGRRSHQQSGKDDAMEPCSVEKIGPDDISSVDPCLSAELLTDRNPGEFEGTRPRECNVQDVTLEHKHRESYTKAALNADVPGCAGGKAVANTLKRRPEGRSEQPGPPTKSRRREQRAETAEEGTDFTVALINFMDPEDPELSLKPEPHYGMGPLAVSWHMDGNLLRGSTVAVYSYNCQTTTESGGKRDWMVGIRRPWDEETPGLATPLVSGDTYFMLADLNDTHQHCVIAGDQPRFASTHRVVNHSSSTLRYIQARCDVALSNLERRKGEGGREEGRDGGGKERHALRTLDQDTLAQTEEIHNEVEFDWLRQFWMQGTRHTAERTFWSKPMEDLEHAWELMEIMTKLAVDESLRAESSAGEAVITTLLPFLEKRERLRCEWTNRYGGDVLLSMHHDRLPLYRPTWDDGDPSRPLPFTLNKIIKRLRAKQTELCEVLS